MIFVGHRELGGGGGNVPPPPPGRHSNTPGANKGNEDTHSYYGFQNHMHKQIKIKDL